MALRAFLASRAVEATLKIVHAELDKGTPTGNKLALANAREAVDTASQLPSRTRERRKALLLLGWALNVNGEPEKALEIVSDVWAAAPSRDAADDLDAAALNNTASILAAKGEHRRAADLYLETLQIKRRVLGPNTRDLLGNLEDLFNCAVELGDTTLVLETAKELQRLIGLHLGEDHPAFKAAIRNVLLAQRQAAEEQGVRLSDLAEPPSPFDEQDPEAPAIITAFETRNFNHATALYSAWIEKRLTLIPMIQVAASVLHEGFDPVLRWAAERDRRGLQFEAAGNLEGAASDFEQVAAVMSCYPNRPDRIAAATSNHARILTKLHRFEGARSLLLGALNLTEGLGLSEVRQRVMQNLASLYLAIADVDAPDPAANPERFFSLKDCPSDLTVQMRVRYPLPIENESPLAAAARSLAARSAFYDSIADTNRARRLLELSLELWRLEAPTDRAALLPSLLELIQHDLQHGRPDAAETELREALALLRGLDGDALTFLKLTLQRLQLVFSLGRLGDAREVASDLEAFARRGDVDDHLRGIALENLAICRLRLGERDAARPILEEILVRAGGAEDADPATLAQLAQYAMALGWYDRAEAWLFRAMEVWKEETGEWTAAYAKALSNAGTVARYRGDWPLAAERHARAMEIRRLWLGAHHPEVLESCVRLIMALVMTGRRDSALHHAVTALEVATALLGRASMMSSEASLLDIIERHTHILGLAIGLLDGAAPERVADVYSAVLRQKAFSALALLTRRNAVLGGRYPDLKPMLDELHELQGLLSSATLGGRETAEVLTAAEDRRDELEGELARKIPEMALDGQVSSVTTADLAAALPNGAVLAEILAYIPWEWDRLAADSTLDGVYGLPRYALFILRRGGEVRLSDLGPAEAIDADVRRATAHFENGEPARGAVDQLAQTIAWPITQYAHTVGASQIYFAPDRGLCLLAFDALPDDSGEPLLERFEVTHLATGRDLLRPRSKPRNRSAPVIVCAPDFDIAISSDGGDGQDGRHSLQVDTRGMLKVRFKPLPGTVREAEALFSLFPEARIITGQRATRTALESAVRPAFLHLATHGYFMPATTEKLKTLSPMLRSGLVLAGANAASHSSQTEPLDEGLLTAAAVATLDLLDTDLVTMSACESGLGDTQRGEGVFGLRRAFAVAGARTVVMSLWKVRDASTAELMRLFYEGLARGQGKSSALRAAKLARRKAAAPTRDWAAFILEGEAAPLAEFQTV